MSASSCRPFRRRSLCGFLLSTATRWGAKVWVPQLRVQVCSERTTFGLWSLSPPIKCQMIHTHTTHTVAWRDAPNDSSVPRRRRRRRRWSLIEYYDIKVAWDQLHSSLVYCPWSFGRPRIIDPAAAAASVGLSVVSSPRRKGLSVFAPSHCSVRNPLPLLLVLLQYPMFSPLNNKSLTLPCSTTTINSYRLLFELSSSSSFFSFQPSCSLALKTIAKLLNNDDDHHHHELRRCIAHARSLRDLSLSHFYTRNAVIQLFLCVCVNSSPGAPPLELFPCCSCINGAAAACWFCSSRVCVCVSK